MEYLEALKKVQAKKPKENYLVVVLGYDNKLVFPYKDGMAFMSSLTNVEKLSESYSDPHRITEFDRGAITTHLMSADEYERFKIAALLNVTPDEVKQYATQT